MRLLLDTHAFLWFSASDPAQALAEELTLVSADEAFDAYAVRRLW